MKIKLYLLAISAGIFTGSLAFLLAGLEHHSGLHGFFKQSGWIPAFYEEVLKLGFLLFAIKLDRRVNPLIAGVSLGATFGILENIAYEKIFGRYGSFGLHVVLTLLLAAAWRYSKGWLRVPAVISVLLLTTLLHYEWNRLVSVGIE